MIVLPNIRIVSGMVWCIIFLLGNAIFSNAQSVKLPADPYEGMQITYLITGAGIAKEMNKPGVNKWQRNLVLTALSPDSALSISGYLYSAQAHSVVTITLGAGRESVTREYDLGKGSGMDFTQQIQVPPDARSANIYINMCVLLSPRQEARELVLFAIWDGKWKQSFK